MRTRNQTQQDIDDLTQALEQLRLAQENLNSVISRLRGDDLPREAEQVQEDLQSLPVANVIAEVDTVHSRI